MILMLFCLTIHFAAFSEQIHARIERDSNTHLRRRVIDAKGGPESLIWVVQLSDLHFSAHHPDRALDFRALVGPALSMINPSLVLITGDLTGAVSLSFTGLLGLWISINFIFELFFFFTVLNCFSCFCDKRDCGFVFGSNCKKLEKVRN